MVMSLWPRFLAHPVCLTARVSQQSYFTKFFVHVAVTWSAFLDSATRYLLPFFMNDVIGRILGDLLGVATGRNLLSTIVLLNTCAIVRRYTFSRCCNRRDGE